MRVAQTHNAAPYETGTEAGRRDRFRDTERRRGCEVFGREGCRRGGVGGGGGGVGETGGEGSRVVGLELDGGCLRGG